MFFECVYLSFIFNKVFSYPIQFLTILIHDKALINELRKVYNMCVGYCKSITMDSKLDSSYVNYFPFKIIIYPMLIKLVVSCIK